jgi:SNF2 family DNA or RNA helicase
MEMRLGKTLVAIRRCLLYKPTNPSIGLRILVVAPSSALPDWETELRTERQKDVVYLQGSRENRLDLLTEEHRWNLINKEGWMVVPEIADVEWDAVIIDESTVIKNVRSQITKFYLNNFQDVPHRWALSGLPNPESDLEFWAQMAWLDGGWAFGSGNFYAFRNTWFDKERWGYGWIPKKGVLQDMHDEVGQRAFVMTRQEAGLDVPKVYERRYLELPSKLRRAYTTAEKEFLLEYKDRVKDSTFNRIVTYTWCRQMCSGFIGKRRVWSGKEKELLDLLQGNLSRQAVVVWFAYNRELSRAMRALHKAGIKADAMVGTISKKRRKNTQRAFQRGRFRVLCAQIKCADRGVNLSRASAAIYYSNSPSCEQRVQTEDRILKAGEDDPLLYIDLVVQGTVDEDLSLSLRGKKERSQRALNRALMARFRHRRLHRCA